MGFFKSESKRHELVATGTNSYVDIQYGNKTARFWGDLCANGFAAIESTMQWLSPEGKILPNSDDKAQFISAVRRHFRWKRFKVFFVDDKGRKIRIKPDGMCNKLQEKDYEAGF